MVTIKKKGLGRGLDALLGEKAQKESSPAEINRLPLTALQAGKYQPRQKWRPAHCKSWLKVFASKV